MNVLIACEESQTVCIEFRKKGHNAFSADIIECSGGHPEWHILGDVLPVLEGGVVFNHGRKRTLCREMGFAYRTSAVYVSDKCWRTLVVGKQKTKYQKILSRRNRSGTFHVLYARTNRANCNRKSCSERNLRTSSLQPNYRTIRVRTQRNEENMPVDQRTSEIKTDKHCSKAGI